MPPAAAISMRDTGTDGVPVVANSISASFGGSAPVLNVIARNDGSPEIEASSRYCRPACSRGSTTRWVTDCESAEIASTGVPGAP